MKKLILLLTFSLSYFLTFPQDNLVVVDNPSGDDYILGRINLKVKPEFRSYFAELKNTIPGFEALEITGLRRKFPQRKPLEKHHSDGGIKLPDLSLIYELDYNSTQDVFKTGEQLMSSGLFDYAEPHYVSYPLFIPDDNETESRNPYHFNTMQLYAAWDVGQGDTNVVIGYTDTSFDLNHQDLSGNVKYNYADPIGGGNTDGDPYTDNFAGWDLVDNDNNLFINNEFHGTSVAAVGSATTDNTIGISAPGFKCKFLPVKVANSSQVITQGYEGIVYCVDHGAKVVNCSWGNTTFNQLAQDVTDDAILTNDVVLVASGGNISYDTAYYPASYRFVLSVTGVDSQDRFDPPSLNPFSWNDSIDVSAPGFDVFSTATFNGSPIYSQTTGGSSIAAPLVAGVAGLVRSHFPGTNALQVIERIKCTADNIDGITENIPYAGKIGTGRVNAYAALTSSLCGPVNVIEENRESSVLIYPNPASDVLNVVVKSVVRSPQSVVKIYNTTGEVVSLSTSTTLSVNSVEGRQSTLDISALASGIYFVHVVTEEQTFSRKITIVK